jgi:hypothetical protein
MGEVDPPINNIRKRHKMSEPVLVALLFADRVIVEDKNLKKALIGVFSIFHAEKFPAVFAPWYIYASVTNLFGEHNYSLNLVYDKAAQVIIPIGGKIVSDNARRVVELVFPIFGAVFPEEGTYTLTFNIEGVPIGSRILEVVKMQQPGTTEPIQE